MILPKAIKPGDTIGVISSSDLIREKDLECINKSKKLFEDLGYNVKFGKYVIISSSFLIILPFASLNIL